MFDKDIKTYQRFAIAFAALTLLNVAWGGLLVAFGFMTASVWGVLFFGGLGLAFGYFAFLLASMALGAFRMARVLKEQG